MPRRTREPGDTYDPELDGEEDAPFEPARPFPKREPRKGGIDRRGVQLGILSLVILLALYGVFGTSPQMTAECGPFYQPCRVIATNTSYWPQRIDPGSAVIDGTPVSTIGSGIAWPFGSAELPFYDSDGNALHTMKTVHVSAGPLLGPSNNVDFNMQGNDTPTPGPSMSDIVATDTPVVGDTAATDTPTTDSTVATDTPDDANATEIPQQFYATDTPVVADTSQNGNVHICGTDNFDSAQGICNQDDDQLTESAIGSYTLTWPRAEGGTNASLIQLFYMDTVSGDWKLATEARPNSETASDADHQYESLPTFFGDAATSATPWCNSTMLIRVVNAGNHRFGQAPFTLSC